MSIKVAGLATLRDLVVKTFPDLEDRETFRRCMRTGEDLPVRLQPAALKLADEMRRAMIEDDA